MSMRFLSRQKLMFLGGGYAFSLLMFYAWVYRFQPFNITINRAVLDGLTAFSALSSAMVLTAVLTYYRKGEPSRRIWMFFAIGIWVWFVADIAWGAYNLVFDAVPEFSFADILWFSGYIFFTFAIVHQYRLVFFDRSRRPLWIAIGVWVVVILMAVVLLVMVGDKNSPDSFFACFYPFADFAVGLSAIILVITFRGSMLARPWLSLFIFVIADSLYLWATATGVYDWSATSGDMLTFIVDIVYVFAYLTMGWGAFQQYLLLKFHSAIEQEPVLQAG